MQDVPGGKVIIQGGHSIGHSRQKECISLLKTATTQQLMKYFCNFKQYFATCFGFQEAIIRQIRT
jgi:hypothetical protein